MKELHELSVDELKSALWHLNDGRCPGKGIFASKNEIRYELYCRTGELLGFHEEPYDNSDGKCECYKCEQIIICAYAGNLQRFPKKKGFGLCPKLKAR